MLVVYVLSGVYEKVIVKIKFGLYVHEFWLEILTSKKLHL
jgi:hypothetical protein